jgi:formate hydrogenlyase transcriptional activator
MQSPTKQKISGEICGSPKDFGRRYEAILRLSEALSRCQEPEDLTEILSEELREFLTVLQFYIIVYKENSTEVEWAVLGQEKNQIASYADVPVQQRPSWQAYITQEPFRIDDWKTDQRIPARLKDGVASLGLDVGPLVFVPLTSPHRPLGALGVSGTPGTVYTDEDIAFLRLVGRVVALAIDDNFNRRQAETASAELQRQIETWAVQNSRLELLLRLTKEVTSNLDLREVLRATSANARELMHADAAGIAFYDDQSQKSHIYAVNFPGAKGIVNEELVVRPGCAFLRAWRGSKAEIVNTNDSEELGPEVYQVVTAEGLNSHCHIPLVNRGRTVGVLIVASKQANAFTREDVDFLTEASGQIALAIENCFAYREVTDLKEKLAQEKLYLESEIRGEMDFEQIVGNSPPLKRVLQLVETVATADSTVLLLGETGTGKELIARAIHDKSRRKDRTFVKVNCAAIPTGLLESELFGHEKGAFTGAIIQKIGRLELADQGTLFLDEVGDIPRDIQPKLLRALQEREFERLGSTRTRTVNVRLIAATNRDLETMVASNEFRIDLYYRLNVFPIRIPPLRERKDDIPLLVTFFVEKFAKQMQKRIDNIPISTMKALRMWEWPGNIRELENFMERAVILTRGRSLEAPLAELRKPSLDDVPHILGDQDNIARIVKETIKALHANSSVDREGMKKQRDAIVRALTESKGRVGGAGGAAAHMGINRTTLWARMKKFGIDPRDYI